MARALRVLHVEDSERDVALLTRHLERAGFDLISDRVETCAAMKEALKKREWDVILCDYSMPHFSALRALALLKKMELDIPFIIISGTVGEVAAVEAMRAGASDYLMKDNLTRLAATIERELHEAENRRARRLAEAAQKASEEELRALFSAMTDLIFVLDAEGRYLRIAPTDPTYLYKPSAELIGKTLHEVFSTEQADFLLAHIRRALDEGQAHRVEYSLSIERAEIWFDGSVSPLSRDSVLWIARDISERKRTEEALRESEERYRMLFESNPQPMWVFDLETLAFLAINEAAMNHYGYSREEFLAMTIKDIRLPEEVPSLLKRLAIPVSFDRAGMWKHHKKDGSIIDVEITSHQLGFAGRRAELVLVNDVTERMKAEAALGEAEEKYRSIFENAVEGIFQSTTEGRWISVNSALAHMLGYESPQEMVTSATDIERQLYANPNSRSEYRKILEEHNVVRGFITQLRRKDGSSVWVSVSTRAVRDVGGAIIYYEGFVEDISERKLLEEQLQHSQKMEAVGRLAGGIAHDFNNLLTAIIGYSDLVMPWLKGEASPQGYVEEIRSAGERAASLTRQLLAFSRKQVLQPRVLNINSLVTDVSKMLRRLVGEDIEFIALLRPEAGLINADAGQIEQVLMNLVVNARDAMPQGGKIIIETANAELGKSYADLHSEVEPGSYVMLAVSDTGCGMDEETRARIFEPFFTTKEVGKGTGLGLSTVYGIVKQSGGSVWVYSERGHGTTFKVYLPRIVEEAQESKPAPEHEEPLRGTETVLLAEDEEVVRRLAREVLEGHGYRVLGAANGGAAAVACKGHDGPIHLLITDVVMPGMGGRDLANHNESVVHVGLHG
jgi:two-component system, cell cycle sensor histidine kinase and response regulator CckA